MKEKIIGLENESKHIEKPNSNFKSRRYYIIGSAFVVVLLLGVSFGVMISATTPTGFPTVIEPGSMTSSASFIIFTDGINYFVKNGTSGAIAYSGSSARIVIQSAITALVSTGGTILFKSGVYLLKGAAEFALILVINGLSNIHLIGEDNAVLKLDPTSWTYTNILTIIASDNITVEGLVFDWNGVAGMIAPNSYYGSSIGIKGSDGLAGRPGDSADIVIRDCRFLEGSWCTVSGAGKVRDIEVSNCYFLGPMYVPLAFEWGLEWSTGYIDIISKPNGIILRNNEIVGTMFRGIHLSGIDDVLVEGNNINVSCEGTNGHIIAVYEGDEGLGCSNIRFLSNIISGISALGKGVSFEGNITSVLIHGNDFDINPKQDLIYIDYAQLPGTRNIEISSNTITLIGESTGSDSIFSNGYDVRILGNEFSGGPEFQVNLGLASTRHIIQGNTFINAGWMAILARGGNYSIISNNLIFNWSVAYLDQAGIWLHGGCYISVMGNNLGMGGYTGFGNSILEDLYSDYNIIAWNLVHAGSGDAIVSSGPNTMNWNNTITPP